eukprot:8474429-Lingulodinium_polyedra.AAC.1
MDTSICCRMLLVATRRASTVMALCMGVAGIATLPVSWPAASSSRPASSSRQSVKRLCAFSKASHAAWWWA